MSRSKTATASPDDDLRRQLELLKLGFILEHFEELAGKAGAEQWSHVEFLVRLIEGEAALRQDRARQRCIKQARFPVLIGGRLISGQSPLTATGPAWARRQSWRLRKSESIASIMVQFRPMQPVTLFPRQSGRKSDPAVGRYAGTVRTELGTARASKPERRQNVSRSPSRATSERDAEILRHPRCCGSSKRCT